MMRKDRGCHGQVSCQVAREEWEPDTRYGTWFSGGFEVVGWTGERRKGEKRGEESTWRRRKIAK